MKLLIILLSFMFFIVAFAAPKSSDESEFVTEDDLAKKSIEKVLGDLLLLSSDNDIAKALVKSIDRECMLKKYKSHSLLEDMLTGEDPIDLSSFPGEDKSIDSVIVFANIALTCSNKLNALLGFLFDNLFSYSGLLDAFREDEPIKGFIDELNCYNNYAVRHEYLDPTAYSHLNYKLVNGTEAECDASLAESKDALVSAAKVFSEYVLSDFRKCIEHEIFSSIERFFFRYALLVPLGLTDDQEKIVKHNFVNDALDGLQKLLVCNVKASGNVTSNEIAKH